MNDYDVFFWLSIVGGYICFILIQNLLRLIVRKSNIKDAKVYIFLTILLMVGFVFLNPVLKIIKLPDILSENYANSNMRLIVGMVLAAFFAVDMVIYYFWNFHLRLYRKNSDKYSIHVYHNAVYLLFQGVWLISLFGTLLFLSVAFGNYKSSWNMGMAFIVISVCVGKVILSVLDAHKLIVKGNHFYYYSFKKKYEGDLREIKSAKFEKAAISLNINEELVEIKCIDKFYAELFCRKISGEIL